MPIRFSLQPTARLITCSVEEIAIREDCRVLLDADMADRDFGTASTFYVTHAGSPGIRTWPTPELRAREVTDWFRLPAPCLWAVATWWTECFRMVRLRGIRTLGCGVEEAQFQKAACIEAGTAERRAYSAS